MQQGHPVSISSKLYPQEYIIHQDFAKGQDHIFCVFDQAKMLVQFIEVTYVKYFFLHVFCQLHRQSQLPIHYTCTCVSRQDRQSPLQQRPLTRKQLIEENQDSLTANTRIFKFLLFSTLQYTMLFTTLLHIFICISFPFSKHLHI